MEILLFYWLLLSVQVPLVTCYSCWTYNIEHCNSYVKPYIPKASIKYYTRQQLGLFCAAKVHYDGCMNLIWSSCERTVQLELQGARDSNNYLCSPEGFDLMVKHSPCFRDASVQFSVGFCDDQLQLQLKRANTTSQKCSMVDDYLYCVEEGVAKVCGNEAGHFVYQANILILKPLYKDFGCSLGSYHYHMIDGGHMTNSASLWTMTLIILSAGLFNYSIR